MSHRAQSRCPSQVVSKAHFHRNPTRSPFLYMSHRAQSRCPANFTDKLIFKTSFLHLKFYFKKSFPYVLFSHPQHHFITSSQRYSVTSSQRQNIFFLQLKFPCTFQLSQTHNLIILFLGQVIIYHKKGKIHNHRLLSHNDP